MERPKTNRGNDGAAAEASSPSELKEQILARSPFRALGGASRQNLLELGAIERFDRKIRLFQQGEAPRSVLLLGAGRVKLERVDHGRAFVLGHRGPGEMVGEAALAGQGAALEHAVVLDEVEALSFGVAGLRKLVAADPELRVAATAALVERQLEAESRLSSLLLRDVEARLVEFLTSAARRWGLPHPSGQLVSAAFTHADIALLIGSTRETVTLLLGRLKRAGLIDLDRRRIVIRDAAGLEQRPGTT